MADGGGVSLGAARGSIEISTTQLETARAHVRAFATGVDRDLRGLNSSTTSAERSLSKLSGAFRDLAGAAGISLSIAGVVQIARASVELAKVSAQAEVTRASFDSLSQGVGQNAEKMLEAMQKASRGTISDAGLILSANRAIISGVADDTRELAQLLEIARATGRAFGVETSDAFSRIVRGISKLEPELLDELGITVRLDTVFKEYAASLGVATDKLSEAQRRQALFNAVIKQSQPAVDAARKQGDTAADSYDRLGASWDNAAKSFGKLINTAGAPTFLDAISEALDRDRVKLQAYLDLLIQVGTFVRGGLGMSVPSGFNVGTRSDNFSNRTRPSVATAPRFTQDQSAAMVDWARGVADIERNAANDRLDATKQFEQQRSSTIREYNQTIVREAQDFATQRARAEQDLADSIADIHADASRREVQQAEELARQIGQARADSAERLADMQEDLERTLSQRRADSADKIAEWVADRDEAIADRRKDSAARLLEIEQEYAEQRERSQRDHNDRLSDAAARLDANAVYEEQRRFRRESEDALAARDEQVSDEKTKLQEAIDQLNKAHAERLSDEKKALDKANSQAQEAFNRQVADEKEALDKRINQANAAHAQQLADAKAADAQRILDMQEDFAERIAQEDIDRGIRLGRLATDHNDQLTEMDRAHNERINQIGRHAGEERKALDDEFQTRLGELELQTDAWITEQQRITDEAIEQFDKWWDHITGKTIIGPLPKNPVIIGPGDVPRLNPVQPGVNPGGGASPVQPSPTPYAAMAAFNYPIPPVAATAATGTGGNVTTLTIAPGAVVVYGAPGQSEERLANLIDQRLLHRIQQAAKGL